jgi:hypothetical protein
MSSSILRKSHLARILLIHQALRRAMRRPPASLLAKVLIYNDRMTAACRRRGPWQRAATRITGG